MTGRFEFREVVRPEVSYLRTYEPHLSRRRNHRGRGWGSTGPWPYQPPSGFQFKTVVGPVGLEPTTRGL